MARQTNPYRMGYRPGSVATAGYLTPLVLRREIEAVKKRRGEDALYVVGAPYKIWYAIKDHTATTLTVPAGLVTDLSSVPRIGRSIINRVGPHLEASIVHDFLYVAWQDVPGRGARREDKGFADDLFLALMVAANVSPLKRQIIYRAVDLFGWPSYSRRDDGHYVSVPQLGHSFS